MCKTSVFQDRAETFFFLPILLGLKKFNTKKKGYHKRVLVTPTSNITFAIDSQWLRR